MLEGHWILKIHKKTTVSVILSIILIVISITIFLPFATDSIAFWLTERDKPEKSDIIFVFGGEGYRRVPFAIELYKKGYGKKIIIIIGRQDKKRIETEKKYCISPYEETSVKAILNAENITYSSVTILKDSLSTIDDAYKLRNYYDKEKFFSAIAVTDPVHSKRAMMCIRWEFKNTDVKFCSYPLPLETYETYFTEKDDYINFVFMELLRYTYYFTGLKRNN